MRNLPLFLCPLLLTLAACAPLPDELSFDLSCPATEDEGMTASGRASAGTDGYLLVHVFNDTSDDPHATLMATDCGAWTDYSSSEGGGVLHCIRDDWNDDPESMTWSITWNVESGVSYHVAADLYGPSWGRWDDGDGTHNTLLSSTGSGCQVL